MFEASKRTDELIKLIENMSKKEMTKDEVINFIIEKAKEISDVDLEKNETLSEAGFDSLDVVDMVMELENKFDVFIEDESDEFNYFADNTVEDYAEIIIKHTKDQPEC